MTPTAVRLASREWRAFLLLGLALTAVACARGFRPQDYASPEAPSGASLFEFQQKKYENAQAGFERLTADLSARDPLLAPAYYYLGLAHEERGEYLLASQAFQHITDGFPDDTLAPAAMLGVGRNYQLQWRRPQLDPENGQKAISQLRALLSSYPDAAREVAEAKSRIAELEEWFANKDYQTGMHYVTVRRSIDPAIIYFKDVVTTYPRTKAARLSWLKLHELYTKIRWKDDAAETCTAMWKAYPGDAQVQKACGVATADSAPASAPKPPSTLARPGPR